MNIVGKIRDEGMAALAKEQNLARPHKTSNIWVLIADSQTARIYRKIGHKLELIGEAENSKPSAEEIADNNLGRTVVDRGGNVKNRLEPHMDADPTRKAVHIFARDLLSLLEEAVAENAFDKVVLIAGPKMLGEMRNEQSKEFRDRVAAEIPKDLTKMDEDSIRSELENIVSF